MPKGSSTKGYKMTENRRRILNLLVEEGGQIKSKEGRATSLMHGILDTGTSVVSLNASLRELENLAFIKREIDGRRTYAIGITPLGRKQIDAADAPAQVEPETVSVPAAATAEVVPAVVPEEEWEWKDDDGNGKVPSDIDYEVLLGVFIKAALRGMEGPSNSELDFYKQQNELLTQRVEVLEADVEKFRAEAASAIAERDQLQKNLNLLMTRSDKVSTRGTDPIRKLLTPSERSALDQLMRQVPTRRGD